MPETKHTPVPWAIRDIPLNDKRSFRSGQTIEIFSVPDDADEIVTMPNWSEQFMDEAMANARFIVQACNAHDALVKAMKDAIEEFDEWEGPEEIESSQASIARNQCVRVYTAMKAALALATGEKP